MIYHLDVACNDPDNGIFEGRASMLEIGDAEFMADNRTGGCAFVELPGAIRIAGKTWRTAGCKEWVGNWCWNRYDLYHPGKTTRWYLVDFVTWLRGRKLFSCTGAPCEFYDWFNSEWVITPAEVHHMVCDLEPPIRRAA